MAEINKYKRITIKIGSSVLTRKDGKLHMERIAHIVNQIAELHNQGVQVILISSGAVAAGKGEYRFLKEINEISSRQVWSAIGQVQLMVNYFSLFGSYNIQAAQILATKENFQGLRYYSNMKNCISSMLDNKIIPIVNENDTITVTELMFTDNDELSGLISGMMDCDALFIFTVVDGVYNGMPGEEGVELIEEIDADDKTIENYITPQKSGFGRGGMYTKFSVAQKVAKQGIDVYIANGQRENILLDIIEGKDTPRTLLKTSNTKPKDTSQWLPRTTTFPKASVTLKEAIADLLKTKKDAINIQTEDIEQVDGFFEVGDLVKIFDNNGKQLGIGKVKYSAEEFSYLKDSDSIQPFIDCEFMLLYKY